MNLEWIKAVVNAQLNELPVKFSVCVNEGQDKLPTIIGFLSFTKDRTKLDLSDMKIDWRSVQTCHFHTVAFSNFR